LAILQGKIVPPYEVEIQPSSLCNLACKHCFGRDYQRLPNKISRKEFDILADRIDEFQDNGFKIETIKFCGTTGEPLVNPLTLYAIQLFKKRGKKVIVFTNGLNLDKPFGNSGLKYYDIIAKSDRMILSLDAGSEEVFFNLKGKYGFERIIKSLEEIAKIRKKEKTGIDIRVGYVVGKPNYKDIVNATKRVKDAGANEIVFRVDFTNVDEVQKISKEIIKEIKSAKKYEDNSFKVISIYSDEEISGVKCGFNSNGQKCFNHNFWTCIGPNCELYACGHRTYGGVESYGSLLKNSFRKLWTSKERQEAVKCLPDNHCKNCSPSSKYRNDFMNFLSGLSKEDNKELIESV